MPRCLSLWSSLALVVALAACGEVKSEIIDGPPGAIDAATDGGPPPIDGPAIDAPPQAVTLTVIPGGTSTGVITSDPAGISCGVACTGSFLPGTLVTLTAAPGAGAGFTGWGGGCSGALTTCSLSLAADTAVNANFDILRHGVLVTTAGNGTGTVTASSIGINCPGTCMTTVDHGTSITFTATPMAGSTFIGWSGACTGTGPCTVTAEADVQLSAAFAQNLTLVVTKSGTGTGSVASTPVGINCGPDCSEVYPINTSVTLTPTASADSVFAGWTGACTGTGACTVTIDASKTVNAIFNLRQFTLTVTKGGDGVGTVTSTITGINCGLDCNQAYDINTSVTLVATPGTDSLFSGWGGACTGTSPMCTVTMSQARSVSARFDQSPTVTLSVQIRGGGRANILTTPISGPTTCTNTEGNPAVTCMLVYNRDTTVNIRLSPQTGSMFSDWTGCDSVSGSTCTVLVQRSQLVSAFLCPTGSC